MNPSGDMMAMIMEEMSRELAEEFDRQALGQLENDPLLQMQEALIVGGQLEVESDDAGGDEVDTGMAEGPRS